MRRLIISAVSTMMLIFLGQGTTCLAQNLPNGTYQRTCQDINFNGAKLWARCQNADGGWNNTSLDYRNCGGREVTNDNGNLRCAGGHPPRHSSGWPGRFAPGGYKPNLPKGRINGNKMYATCQTADGGWHDTSLSNVNQCQSPIANNNGNLRCPK